MIVLVEPGSPCNVVCDKVVVVSRIPAPPPAPAALPPANVHRGAVRGVLALVFIDITSMLCFVEATDDLVGAPLDAQRRAHARSCPGRLRVISSSSGSTARGVPIVAILPRSRLTWARQPRGGRAARVQAKMPPPQAGIDFHGMAPSAPLL